MSEISVHLVDNVLPHAPYRQWVTTFPHALRYWMAASRKLTSLVHGRVNAMIQLYYTNKAEERGIKDPVAGGVTFVQRFGSALNAHVHFHTVAFDGVFSVKGPEPVFYQLPGPKDEEVADIIIAVAQVIVKDLKAKGFLVEEGEAVTLDPTCLDEAFGSSEQLAAALAASASMRIAFGERAGMKVRRIGKGFGYEDEPALAKGRRCFSVNGFSLHANRFVGTKERGVLEKLLAYGARGAFSHRRLSLADPNDPSGDLVYTLKTPWSDGTEAIKLSARELIEKLVALIPPPYIHMSRYFGILASHSKWRRQVLLRPDVKKGFVALQDGVERMSWAKLLARVFAIDIERCPACQAPLYPEGIEIVVLPNVVHAILLALGLAGRAPARAPPRQLFAELDIDQSAPDFD
jgi:hypothetical protein